MSPLDEKWMRLALRQAEMAFDEGEIPIGAVIVQGDKLVGRGHNQVELLKDATAHAEILAITAASQTLENWRLEDCTLYVTLEPCPMCAGAILNSRLARVVYAAPDKRLGACGTCLEVIPTNLLGREIIVEGGLMADEGLGMLQAFFRQMRARKGDSGAKELPLDSDLNS